jgi:hypothetical protein
MNRTILIIAIAIIASFGVNAQKMKNDNTNPGNYRDEKIALRELVDTFSILADKKDTKGQVLLFTANGNVTTFVNGAEVSNLTGRDKLDAAFAAYLRNFDTVYHFNGQHVVTINADTATGTLYCLVTLIGTENGKRMKTTIGVVYNDNYVRDNGRWLIAKRTSYFTWQDKRELGQ